MTVERIRRELGVSERRACRALSQPRSTHRYEPKEICDEEARLTRRIIELASEYGRYGYRRIMALLWREGWQVGKDQMERIWRQEGLKVPQKQPKRGRLWLNDGSAEAAQTGPALAERRFLHPSSSGTPEPRVVL